MPISLRVLIPSTAVVLLGLSLSGCSAPRIVERDRYFQPVIRRVQPIAPTPRTAGPATVATPSADASVRILEGALAESRRELLEIRLEIMSLRDSMRVIGAFARYQREASLALVDKVAVLEQQLAATARSAVPVQPAPDPSPLARTETATASRPAPSLSRPSTARVASTDTEYQEGVDLFNRRRYDESRRWFARLLEEGIREDLADNCEYWVGESDFARGRWTSAVESFERVVALRGSNKRADALFMLGRSLEMLRQTSRARAAYERLATEYPSSWAARNGLRRLRLLPSEKGSDTSGGPVLS